MSFQQLSLAYGLIFVGLVLGYGVVTTLARKALPRFRVIRSGTEVEGTMVGMQLPVHGTIRTRRPVLRFPGPDGTYVRFQDLNVPNCDKQPGETVAVRYDPADPKGSATIVARAAALRLVARLACGFVVAVGFVVVGILMLAGVVPA